MRFRAFSALAASLLLLAPAAAEEELDLELCLAVDGSGSIEEDEFFFQRRAYAAALADRRVIQAIEDGFHGAIAVALMEWGGAHSMNPIVGWTRIASRADMEGFAAQVLAAPRKAEGWNSISNAIAFCRGWMADNGFAGYRKVIDVSGDAGQRGGMPLSVARAEALAEGIVINALALNYRGGGLSGPFGQPLLQHFREDVIGGPGAFALGVEEQDQFLEALVRKLVLEIAWRPGARPPG